MSNAFQPFSQGMLGPVRLARRPPGPNFLGTARPPSSRKYLGSPQNRLLDIRLQDILWRLNLVISPAPGGGRFPGVPGQVIFRGELFDPNVPIPQPGWIKEWAGGGLPQTSFDAMVGMIRNPSPEELQDIALIESFFGEPGPRKAGKFFSRPGIRTVKLDNGTQSFGCNPEGGGYFSSTTGQGRQARPSIDQQLGPFLCPSLDRNLSLLEGADVTQTYRSIMEDPAHWFAYEIMGHPQSRNFPPRMQIWNVLPSTPWGEVKPFINNWLAIDRVLQKYPFPTGLKEYPAFWFRLVLPSLRELGRTPGLNESLVRLWITLSIMSNSEQLGAEIADYIDDEEHKAKAAARMKLVAGIAFGVVFAALAPAFLATGFSALKTGLDLMQKRQAAQDLAKTADEMRSQDAAFAAELDHAADVMNFFADEAERAAKLAQEGKSVPEESPEQLAEKVSGAIDAAEVSDYLLVGSLVAALGVAGYFLFTEVL